MKCIKVGGVIKRVDNETAHRHTKIGRADYVPKHEFKAQRAHDAFLTKTRLPDKRTRKGRQANRKQRQQRSEQGQTQ